MTLPAYPPRSARPGRAGRVGWTLIALLALLIAATSARYLTGDADVFLPVQRTVYLAHLVPLMLHVGGAVVALTLGPLQFVRGLRARWPVVHRMIGRLYVVSVLATGVGGLLLAPTTHTGPWTGLAFAVLAVGTLSTTLLAFVAIRRRDVPRHRVWMTRSYAFIFTGVTFRICLVLLPVLGLSFDTAYAVGAWIAWPINLAVAELSIRRQQWPPAVRRTGRRPGRPRTAST